MQTTFNVEIYSNKLNKLYVLKFLLYTCITMYVGTGALKKENHGDLMTTVFGKKVMHSVIYFQ